MMALASCQAMAMAHSPMRSTRLSCVESEIIPRELQVEPPREYWPTPLFWPINRHFEGLTAVSADPPVYVIDDLLDEATCEQLIEMASPHLQRSAVQTAAGYELDPRRTSSELRMAYDAVVEVQGRFSQLLAMPTTHFEPLKVSRYQAGEFFKFHHDCIPDGVEDGCAYCETAWCNRVVTLFVYLRDCERGGETVFPNLNPPLEIQPRRGMGVLHFPARMPAGRGERDSRVGHAGAEAIDEKYICQQWAWSGPLLRDELPADMRSADMDA